MLPPETRFSKVHHRATKHQGDPGYLAPGGKGCHGAAGRTGIGAGRGAAIRLPGKSSADS
jgi:hypothetical protein